MAHHALVHQVQLAVAALAHQRTGVPDFIAGLEQRDIRTDRLDHAGRIPAQHAHIAIGRRHVGADFYIDRIDGNGADFDQQVAAGGWWYRQFHVDQGVGVADGQALAVGDGFHE